MSAMRFPYVIKYGREAAWLKFYLCREDSHLFQVVSNSKFAASLTRITRQVSRTFDMNRKGARGII